MTTTTRTDQRCQARLYNGTRCLKEATYSVRFEDLDAQPMCKRHARQHEEAGSTVEPSALRCEECGSTRHAYNRCPERRDRP